MNLGRAKLILIIAFAGLNMFLAYQLFWPDFGRLTRVAVSARELQETTNLLEDSNYILEASIDRSLQAGSFLTVSPARQVRHRLLYHIIRLGMEIEETEHTTQYRSEYKSAVVHASGLVQVFYNPGVFLVADFAALAERDLTGPVEQFLNENALLPEGLAFDYLAPGNNNRVVLHYHQVIDDMPIFSGRLKVIVEDDHVRAVEIYWLEPAGRIPRREIEVISPLEALKNLVRELGPGSEERIIKEVKLGYYSGEYDAEKWEVPPVWRIVLDGHQHYYINAFTGNLEKDTIIPDQL